MASSLEDGAAAPGAKPTKLTRNSYISFFLTYFGYFCLYLIRKPLPTSKPYIKQEFGLCKQYMLSIMDNSHLIPYSLVAIMFPNVIDKLGGRLSLFMTFFGAGLGISSVYLLQFIDLGQDLANYLLFCSLIFFSGCCQAFGWPSAIKGMAEHMSEEASKAILPVWTTCCFLGSTLGGIYLGVIYSWLGSDRAIKTEVECGTPPNNCTMDNKLYVWPEDSLDLSMSDDNSNSTFEGDLRGLVFAGGR